MLIRNTEPGTFTRLAYHNTKLAARSGRVPTLSKGGVIIAGVCAYAGLFGGRLPVSWGFPLLWVIGMATMLLFDSVIGTLNTLTELHVLDTLETEHDHCGEEGEEEGEPGEEGTAGSSV